MENPSLDKTATFASYDMWEASAKYFLTPKWDINGGIYDLQDNNVKANGATQYAVGTQYYLTKRIMAYVDWARVDNKGNLGFAPYGPGTGSYNSLSTYYPQATVKVPGQKETAVLVGIQIEF
jgi:predicted porin